jgi:hypothetical protein
MCGGRLDVPVLRVIALQFYYSGAVRDNRCVIFGFANSK